MKNRIIRHHRGTLGTVISLVITLIMMGLTFHLCSTIFRDVKVTSSSLTELAQKVDDVSKLNTDSSRLAILQLNVDTIIYGFAKGRNPLEIKVSVGSENKKYHIPKPEICGEQACICQCTEEDEIWNLCANQKCITGQQFNDADFYSPLYTHIQLGDIFGHPITRNGFIFSRAEGWWRDTNNQREYSNPERILEGRFTVTVKKVDDTHVAVCVVTPEQPCYPIPVAESP